MNLEVRMMNPNSVKLDANIRKEIDMDPAFIDSIKHQGVLAPVLGYEDMLGEINIHDGQRRVIAAREAGLEKIPVLVGPAPGSDEARIVEQLALNEARTAMTLRDKSEAAQQLQLFGMEPEVIARKIGRPKKEVDALLSFGVSPLSTELAEHVPDLTLIQATTIAELEADEDFTEEESENLRDKIRSNPEKATHFLQTTADSLERKKFLKDLKRELEEEGHVVIDDHLYGTSAVMQQNIRDFDNNRISMEEHKTCPGHRVYIPAFTKGREDLRFFCVEGDRHKPQHVLEEERLRREEEDRRKRLERERKQEWNSARKVRAEYLAALIRQLPNNAVAWSVRMTMPQERGTYWELRNPTALIDAAGVLPARVSMKAWANTSIKAANTILFAGALAALEHLMADNSVWQIEEKAAYLTQLADWGYTLSTIEEKVIEQAKGKVEE